MSETEESLLLSLLSLGFEHDDCQRVIQNGVTNIEMAIDHLLDRQNMELSNSSSCIDSERKDEEFNQRNNQLKETYNDQLRKRRLEESITRDRVLKNFQADRMRQKDAKKLRNYVSENTDESMTSSNSNLPTDQEEKVHEDAGKIHIRVPNGDNIQLLLPKHATLQEVFDIVLESVEDKSLSYTLMQPFPRKVFNTSDMTMSLEALHLFPSARLVLHVPQQQEGIIDIDSQMDIAEEGDFASASGCGESRLLMGNIKNEINDMEADDTHDVSNSYNLKRQIDSLQMLSAKCIAHRMTILDPKIINSMSTLSSNAASQVIDVLKSWKLLSPKLMSSFIPCKLKEIHLDSYGLAANELLEKLRFHTSITVLSLKSCPLLNDHGVSSCLLRLRHIKFLNLGDCCRLTGNILDCLIDLVPLEVLILDKLKITNENVNRFLKLQELPNLKKLSLDYCPISSDAFHDIKDCPSLQSLSLNNTQVSGLDFLQSFPNLCKLSLQNTGIIDKEFENVRKVENLKSLKLRGTNISDIGLSHLHGLHLTFINTADRQTVGNETIAMLTGFPLQNLDLSDHIHLTDACIPAISTIITLTSLSLSNTKITDDKLIMLKQLQNLEELDLSKTLVTNQVTLLMKELKLLHSINLAWTNIDDNCIEDINPCLQLTKLNLSHTNITNKGIVKLQLNLLNTLILDSTHVTWQGAQICCGRCPCLKVLRNAAMNVLISH